MALVGKRTGAMAVDMHLAQRLPQTMFQFNQTVLDQYGLVFYDGNGTLSNSTVCYYVQLLIADGQMLTLYDNGTTSPAPDLCSSPVRPVQIHGILGIVFGCLYTVIVVMALTNLQSTKRRRQGVGLDRGGNQRQFYLSLLAAMIGVAAGFVAIDVDREVLPGLAFKLQCIFYSLQQPILLACVFEYVCYWTHNSQRTCLVSVSSHTAKSSASYLWTIAFYLADGLSLGLVIARNWNSLTRQWYADSTNTVAKATGTDGRIKAGCMVMLVCFIITAGKMFLVRSQGRGAMRDAGCSRVPGMTIILTTVVCLSVWPVVYSIISTYQWDVSPYNTSVSQISYYYGGMVPMVLILTLINVIGFIEPHRKEQVTKKLSNQGVDPTYRKRPRWWSQSKKHVLGDHTIAINMGVLVDVRGRDERYDSGSKFWWFQSKEGEGKSVENEDESVVFSPTMTNIRGQSHDGQGFDSSVAESVASSSASRHGVQQRQGPVRSMLDI